MTETIQQPATASRQVVSVDFETFLWTPGNLAPKPVCVSVAHRGDGHRDPEAEPYNARVVSNADEGFRDLIGGLLYGEDILVGCNFAAFDLPVIAAAFPEFMPQIFQALEAGRIHDVQIREKLLNLSTHGRLDQIPLPDGSFMYQTYSLLELEKQYLGIDRTEAKEAEDAWRGHYDMLDGKPTSEWPDEAIEYPKDDAINTLLVWEAQEARFQSGEGSLVTQEFHAMVAFALKLMTCWGMKIDFAEKAKVEAMLARELAPEKLNLLIETGILFPSQPAQPYANGAIDKATGQPKMKAPTKERTSRTRLVEIVEAVSNEHGVEIKRTPKDGVSTDAEVLEILAPLDPVLAQYKHRQDLQKLVTTELPRMSAEIVHPYFEVLKETGRTSSRAEEGIPSFNGQNVDPRVRPCFVPRPGHLLCSVDFSGMELVTLGYTCHKLFGYSVIRDKINEDVDLHTYFGAQIAVDGEQEFADLCREAGIATADEVYEAFVPFEKHEHESVRHIFEKYRTTAKPFNLGLPGGLGVKTFMQFAKSYFAKGDGVSLTEEQAEKLIELWKNTFPEMNDYFEHVNSVCKIEDQAFAYVSPLGMVRSGASFCACANGLGLQTPGAEGAKLATYEVTRACYDESLGSMLLGCHPLLFIHDEDIIEIPDDEYAHERAYEIGRIMVEAFSSVITGIKVKAKPVLMRRWYGEAKQRFDENKRLIPWEPTVSA